MYKFLDLFHGLLIGIANIIPGVSGGTLAVILGIYSKLIDSISAFMQNPFKNRDAFIYLSKIGIGALIGIIALSKLLTFLLENHYQPTALFFMGLILGSIPTIFKIQPDMRITTFRMASFFLFFAVVVLLGLSEHSATYESNHWLLLAISGFFAAGAMIIPGISGSFIMVLLGTYSTIVAAVASFQFLTIGIVAIGAILGIFCFSKIIQLLLKMAPSVTYWGILGLIVGSLIQLWPGIALNLYGGISILCLLLGLGISYVIIILNVSKNSIADRYSKHVNRLQTRGKSRKSNNAQ